MKNIKGFTLIELLGVIVILSIIMLIAVPNITSVLDKNERDNFLADAKKLITQAKYEIRVGDVEKPSSSQIVKISLAYLGTQDVSKDSDGNAYDTANSYVVIVRKDGYLEYYVNLVTKANEENYGIRLAHEDELDGDSRRALVVKGFTLPTDTDIKSITEVSGTITSY